MTCCGRICIRRRKINLSTVFAGQNVGIKEVSDKVWLVSFMQYDLGFFDHETGRITSAENPFGAKVLPMCPAQGGNQKLASEAIKPMSKDGTMGRPRNMAHYHTESNHQGLENRLPQPGSITALPHHPAHRRQRLGGMLSYYHRAAA